jgi:predicted metal-dependent phosphoesterase TrpH
MKLCDLHTHTTASDGSDSPAELVRLAAETGLAAVSVTDHDTIAGLDEAESAASGLGIEFIPGVELSVAFTQGNMHLLGYFIHRGHPGLLQVLKKVQDARARRNPMILERLEAIGLPVTMEELEAMSKGGQIGRPHIARAMVERGYVKSVNQAFEKYLKRGGVAYAPKSILSPADAISAVKDAKGIPVLAHPFSLLTETEQELNGIVAELKASGLMGMECYYSEHSGAFTSMCLSIARRHGLIVTGGSDYHGKAKPHIRLGSGKGNLRVPYSCVEALKAARDDL